MLAKLALRNVRRSVRDYAIYFVTLLFGVAVFYAFNSVQSQSILFDLSSASTSIFDMTGQFLSMFSVVIAVVLGLLVMYANRFLIKRRKQEFGTYLLLGMKPTQVSLIVLMETIAVGVVSLIVGLMLGIALSQGLSFFTAGLFNIPMQRYQFVFSSDAFVQTLVCFAAIFVIVALFNTLTIRYYKLIDLLGAGSKNERFRVRNVGVSSIGFVLGVGLLIAAYRLLIESGLMDIDERFGLATILMVVGTLVFFWAVAGFVIALIERTRGVYFKGLAMFTTRQIASKVNTAFLSLSVVCVMLFLSLTVLSTGVGLVSIFTGNVEEGTQYDATITANVYLAASLPSEERLAEMQKEDAQAAEEFLREQQQARQLFVQEGEAWNWSIEERLSSAAPAWNNFVESAAQIDYYQPTNNTSTYGEVLDSLSLSLPNSKQEDSFRPQSVAVVGVSQFNETRKLAGKEPIEVAPDTFAVNNVFDMTEELSRAMVGEGNEIIVGGQTLSGNGQLLEHPLITTKLVTDAATLIVQPVKPAAMIRRSQ